MAPVPQRAPSSEHRRELEREPEMFRKLALALVLAGLAAVAAAPARADDDWHRHHDWRRHEWRGHHHDRRVYPVYPGYAYYYAPPPVVYAPPPAYYAPPALNLVIPLHFR